MSTTSVLTVEQPAVLAHLRDLASFRNRHAGETIIVCGCGSSLNELVDPERFMTIGVNDVGRQFHPTYLVVVNPKAQFNKDRWPYVEQSQAEYLFTQLPDLPVRHPRVIHFKLGANGGTDLSNQNVLHYTRNSPYVALCLAAHMGAKRIGLIGVDFTDHHFFGRTGRHALSSQVARIDREYGRLAEALHAQGIEVMNLSSTSRLTTIPKVRMKEFDGEITIRHPTQSDQSSLRIVSYSMTPVAGVPAILARCISARTFHHARCVWERNTYGNGVTFSGDLEWGRSPKEAVALLEQADVVIVHNGRVASQHQSLLRSKPTVTMAHNYMWNVDQQFVRAGYPGVVVGQYQATLPEFRQWSVVPNPIPIWEPAFQPETKDDVVTICYTPSGKHDHYSQSHRLYWHGKGYRGTMTVLDGLARRFPVRIEAIRDRQISHADSLAMKRRAHIMIDECVTGSYHRNSLEGLATGCVVVNGVGLQHEIAGAMRQCAPDADRLPFVCSSLGSLDEVLSGLVERGSDMLRADGRANRLWMENHWDFAMQWDRFWARIIEAARSAHTPASKSVSCISNIRDLPREVAMDCQAESMVTVVIPHGGVDRLPQLITTLAAIRQRSGVGEVIVAEMGEHPIAEMVAQRWADKHLFIQSNGPFERARALNAGAAEANHEFVLWQDNDLLLPQAFIEKSLHELCARSLDYLIPYTSVRYLSAADSQAVMRGERNPGDCRPVNTFYSQRGAAMCSGGLGLVRRSFLKRYGGFVEGFRGWGGEDNAWNRKVSLLGRLSTTAHSDQHIYHLYHHCSGGYQTAVASAANPHYQENVTLLKRIWSVRSGKQFLEQFPSSSPTRGKLTISDEKRHVQQSNEMPVWTYWEGPCPQWIQACRRTIATHASNVRFLTPTTFNELWDRDRDIDLSRLPVAQRADYIRAFLLQRYGGLWIDADCIVMKPLQPLLSELAVHDFVGHRERSGLVSNGFIGARMGSRIASKLYGRVCQILRSRKSIHWTTLGSEPLSEVVKENGHDLYELPCEQIQPICWSHPEEFFMHRDAAGHEQAFDSNALCYMLSNVQISKYASSRKNANLLGERTFFTYLLNRALDEKEHIQSNAREDVFAEHLELYRKYGDESLSGPGSCLAQTEELRERLPLLIAALEIRTLLDAPCGDLNWMRHVCLGQVEYIGVDINREIIAANQWHYTDSPYRKFQRANLLQDKLPCADAILCRDLLPHLPFADVIRTLENFKSSGASYLITTTFSDLRPNLDIRTGEWRTLNLTLPPFNFPQPLYSITEKCSEAGGAYRDKCLGVWRFSDLLVSA